VIFAGFGGEMFLISEREGVLLPLLPERASFFAPTLKVTGKDLRVEATLKPCTLTAVLEENGPPG